jgi:pentapeptide repeat protein
MVMNWLELLGTLAIPVVVAVAVAWFSSQQSATQTQIEEQRAQDAALQAYFDQMGSLLLEKDLRTSEEGSEVRILARARTLTVLGRLDPQRKTAVMRFLVEAELVQTVEGRGPIIRLDGANLSSTNLGANLSSTNFDFNLNYANFGAILRRPSLFGASLNGANLSKADLSLANLNDADLHGADLSDANLLGASLHDAGLLRASLHDADLVGADLRDAILYQADLSYANLSIAQVNDDQLAGARSLEGATMPNGQKYEDWLKDTKSR